MYEYRSMDTLKMEGAYSLYMYINSNFILPFNSIIHDVIISNRKA